MTSRDELENGLSHILQSPQARGRVELIVRRPAEDLREVLKEAQLDVVHGLIGDNWGQRGSRRTPDRSAHPDMQINLMNARVIELICPDRQRWPLAGDQLYVDLDLSEENLPPGTRLALGTALLEVTDQPHMGCAKFVERFGVDAHKFVNSPERRHLNLRGINAKVVQSGVVRCGDEIVRSCGRSDRKSLPTPK